MVPPVGRPLIILALTFAALTPGFSIAAAIVAIAIGRPAHRARGRASGHQPLDQHAADFLVRTSVTFLTAGAVHYVDRGLRRERRRAEALAARKVAKADQLEGLQRIVRRFDGSRPVAVVMQEVVDDVSTTFDVPLVSAYLPDDAGRLSMVGVAGYDSPFHVIQIGVGIIGRAAATHDAHLRPGRPRRPGLPGRAVRRPQRVRGPGPPRRRAARDRQPRGDERQADHPGAHRGRRDARAVHRRGAALRPPRRGTSPAPPRDRDACSR